MRSVTTALALFLLLLSPPAAAQELPLATDLEVPLPGVTSYAEDIPTPQDVIGHEIGARHTEAAQIVRYFEAVAAASDRVTLEQHGETYEGRPLIHAVVTAPAQQGRLEEIKQANRQLSDAPRSVTDGDLQSLPAVAYMGYSVHGNEASGSEAAILLLYHLAAGSGPAVEEVLQNTIVLIDPAFNPDGRDRFADWANRNRGGTPVTDPQDREHDEPWPGGRTNHYWFDLNRDWLPAQLPESQGRLAVFHDWRPQVLTDYHEMGAEATYFFQPGIPSRTNPNTPDLNQELTAEIATYHARALDRIGSLYYTEESFDDFYYGKGSTYPDANGAVGILFEQASSRALKTQTSKGVLHYAFTVRNQFMTSLSTLEAAANMRERLLRYQRDYYADASETAEDFSANAYVVGRAGQETRAQALAQVLSRHRIRLYELAEDVEAGGQTFRTGAAYVVPTDQPQARLIKALMERTTTFPDSLFYDVSTWTLPLAFGLDYAERDSMPERGTQIQDVAYEAGRVVGRSDYAYVLPWGRYFAPRALYRLQAAGVRPRLMTEGFSSTVGGSERDFAAGAVVIPVAQKDVPADTVQALVRRIAEEDFVDVYAVETGLTPGGADLGSRGSDVLEQPEIALLTGPGTAAYNAGEVWHLLSERFQIPVSLLDAGEVPDLDLSRYTTVVLAGGAYDSALAAPLRRWAEGGGHLITIESGSEWAAEHELAELETREMNLDSLLQDFTYEELQDAYGAQQIGGSILEAELDPSHPLAYGYDETAPFFRRGTTFFEPAEGPGENVAVYAEHPRVSGYISEEMMEQASGTAALVTQELGRGRITLFMSNPNFRAFWYGTNGLFLNAIFLGGAL